MIVFCLVCRALVLVLPTRDATYLLILSSEVARQLLFVFVYRQAIVENIFFFLYFEDDINNFLRSHNVKLVILGGHIAPITFLSKI